MLGSRAPTLDATDAPPTAGHDFMRLLGTAAETEPPQPWHQLGCLRDPFAAAPDPAFFFATPAAQKLYMSLLTVLRIGDGGLLLVTGEAGVGKTLLLHVLQNTLQAGGEQVQLREGTDTGWLDQLDNVAAAPPTRDILLIDGAEAWDGHVISRLEQLYDQRGEQARALRLVIAGRPQIEQRLQRLIATAAGTKITFARLRLEALEPASVADLIEHRLRASGAATQGPFTPAAVFGIAERANGNPGHAIEACRAELAARMPAPPVAEVPAPTQFEAPTRRPGWVLPTAAAVALLAVAAGTLAARLFPLPLPGWQAADAPGAPAAPPPAPVAAIVQPEPPPAALPAPPPEIAPPVYAAALAAISPAAGPPEPKRSAFDAASAFPRQVAAPGPMSAPAPEVPALPGVLAMVASEPATALLPVAAPEPRPAPPPSPAPNRLQLADAEIAALTERGDAYLRLGDLASARPFYERAATAGDANAALLLGQTYDPAMLARVGLRAGRGDVDKAAEWYRRARQLGAVEADRLLANLSVGR